MCVCVFDFVSLHLWECLGAGLFVWVKVSIVTRCVFVPFLSCVCVSV